MTPRSATRFRRFAVLHILFWTACVLLVSCKKPGAAQNSTSGPQLKWQYKSSGMAVTHPAIAADGTIYIGSNRGGLQALSPEGKPLWRTAVASAGVPVLAEDGNIYFDMPQGLIFGVDQQGKTIWDPKYGLIGFSGPPALGPDNNLYYLNTASDLWAFQPGHSDKELWDLETFRENMIRTAILPGDLDPGKPHGGGAIAIGRDGNLYVTRQNFLHSISPSGSVGWTAELTSAELGAPALADDGTIYTTDGSVLYAVSSSGTKKWSFDSPVAGAPVIDTEGVIYFSDGSGLLALNPDGTVKWRTTQQGVRYLTSPVLAADGTLYLGAEFALYALHSDGSLKWKLRVPTPTSSASIAPDGTILFACGYAWLCAVQDSGSPLMQSAWPKQFHDLGNTSYTRP